MECPAHGGWHEEAVKARLNRYCRAAKALGLPNLMNLGGCAGLEDKMSSCLAAGTCNDCQEFVGTTPGDHVINFTPPAHSPVTTPLQQVTIEEPTNPCGEGLMQLQGHPDCCVPNTAFIGDGACDSYEPVRLFLFSITMQFSMRFAIIHSHSISVFQLLVQH